MAAFRGKKPKWHTIFCAENQGRLPDKAGGIRFHMELTIQTPALLFPAVSLLMLAYTNKFLAIANLIRKLYNDYEQKQQQVLLSQISNLRRRLMLIRWMQVAGVASILLCVVTMFLVYEGWQLWAKLLFTASLLLMIGSLIICLVEIFLSAGALRLLLKNLQEKEYGAQP